MKNGIKTRKTVFLILALCWMVLIFSKSAMPADASAAESSGLVVFIGKIFIPDFESWDEARILSFVEKYDHPVRKAAHVTEYAILAFLISMALFESDASKNIKKKRFFISWIISALYAVSDELYQHFVPGRSCEIKDMCIDSSGAAIGVCLAFLTTLVIKYMIIKFYTEKKPKK